MKTCYVEYVVPEMLKSQHHIDLERPKFCLSVSVLVSKVWSQSQSSDQTFGSEVRGPIYKISYDLSHDYLKFIVG